MRIRVPLVVLVVWVVSCLTAAAGAQRTVSEQYLFQNANAERAQRGLGPLHWDTSLYRAAQSHAREMAMRQAISHQFAGEPGLEERGKIAGARFSVISENVAMAPTALIIHDAWMHSPHHRANLLDPSVTAVGISVLQRDGELYAVEDFDRTVSNLSFADQERQVEGLLARTASIEVGASEEARRTCQMDSGYAGTRRPWFVMRYTAGDLTRLPEQLTAKLATGRYHEALVGACPSHEKQFSAFNIAVLLFP